MTSTHSPQSFLQADKAPQEDSSDPAYLDPVLESEEILAAKLSKMSFESVSDMVHKPQCADAAQPTH